MGKQRSKTKAIPTRSVSVNSVNWDNVARDLFLKGLVPRSVVEGSLDGHQFKKTQTKETV